MVQLLSPRTLPKRTQRGGKDFAEEAGFVISEVATLFIDRAGTGGEQALLERVIAALSPAVLDAFGKQFERAVGKLLRQRVATAPEELIGQIIAPISRFLCKLSPGCTADTISEEVANRKGTTVNGAHAWMLRPFLLGPSEVTLRGTKAPLAAGALYLLELDAKFSCAEHGDAEEMLRFYPIGKPYPGARAAIERGCAKARR